MHGRLLPCGEEAILVEVDSLDAVLALEPLLRERLGDLARDVVPAARTVLVSARATDLSRVRDRVAEVLGDAEPVAPALDHGTLVEIPVVFDGPDLDHVADLTGRTRRQVVEAQTSTVWRFGFGGFAPGFAYLTATEPGPKVPRRSSPRTRVPAGSVALADEWCGIYPQDSPGGWQLIGRTDAVLWDLDREPPALLHPGVAVRFVEIAP